MRKNPSMRRLFLILEGALFSSSYSDLILLVTGSYHPSHVGEFFTSSLA
jgi:hypothetical protein